MKGAASGHARRLPLDAPSMCDRVRIPARNSGASPGLGASAMRLEPYFLTERVLMRTGAVRIILALRCLGALHFIRGRRDNPPWLSCCRTVTIWTGTEACPCGATTPPTVVVHAPRIPGNGTGLRLLPAFSTTPVRGAFFHLPPRSARPSPFRSGSTLPARGWARMSAHLPAAAGFPVGYGGAARRKSNRKMNSEKYDKIR